MSDYYRILGIAPGAPQEALKSAYIKKLKQYHPDIYKGADATEKTQQINEAYQTLKDPLKRAAYDRRRLSAGGAQPEQREWGSAAGGGFAPFTDSQAVAQAAGGFAARRQALQSRIEQIIGELQNNIIRQRGRSLDSRLIRDDLERAFLSARRQLLQENAAYYRQILHPLLQPATIALIGQLQDSQQNFISRSLDAALPQLIAAAGSQSGNSGGGAAMGNAGQYAAFWWGLGLSLLLSWLPLLCVGLMLGFGRKTPGRRRFLFGCLLGAAIHILYLAR